MDAPLRCFVAIDLPPGLKAQLSSLITKLQSSDIGDKVRWVKPNGIHLTLKFLGNVPRSRQPEIEAAVREAVAVPRLNPYELTAGGLGVFPQLDQPRVLWVGLGGDLKALNRTQKQIEQALATLGFPPENRPFAAHLTLGRVPDVGMAAKLSIGQFLRAFQADEATHFTVAEVVLMESVLYPDGNIYTPLSHFNFGK